MELSDLKFKTTMIYMLLMDEVQSMQKQMDNIIREVEIPTPPHPHPRKARHKKHRKRNEEFL